MGFCRVFLESMLGDAFINAHGIEISKKKADGLYG